MSTDTLDRTDFGPSPRTSDLWMPIWDKFICASYNREKHEMGLGKDITFAREILLEEAKRDILKLKYSFLFVDEPILNFIMVFLINYPYTSVPFCKQTYFNDYNLEETWNQRKKFYAYFDQLVMIELVDFESYEYKTNTPVRLYWAPFATDKAKKKFLRIQEAKQRPKKDKSQLDPETQLKDKEYVAEGINNLKKHFSKEKDKKVNNPVTAYTALAKKGNSCVAHNDSWWICSHCNPDLNKSLRRKLISKG